MKQISLLQSGAQGWNKNVLDSSSNRFLYSSTLATYVHSLDNFRLEKLVSVHERTITGLTWCPSNPNWFATGSIDRKLVKWDIGEEKESAACTLPDAPIMIDWCQHSVSMTEASGVVAALVKPGNVFLWDTKSNSCDALKSMSSGTMTCLRWNHGGQGSARLAAGHLDGAVWIWDRASDSVLKINDELKRGAAVSDIQWDPLSNSYLIVSYTGGYMQLIDAEASSHKGKAMTDFVQQNVDIEMAAFVRTVPGGFVTVNQRAPVITLWNVSQRTPLELVKVGTKKCGMTAVKAVNGGAAGGKGAPVRFLLSFTDGSVGVFDWENRRLEFSTQPAHSETIFDCRFKPSNPNVLATASYDSTIKVWDTVRQQCVLDLKGQEGVLYALSWCPGGDDENRLVSASSTGEAWVWDAKKGLVLAKHKLHSKPIFRIAWNRLNPKTILSTSSDEYAIIFNPEETDKRIKYKHPSAVYGCDWNPFNKDVFATGCHDGLVRIFDTTSTSTRPVAELAGHSARVFNVVWSPLVPDMLCSGSDDKTIRIWSGSSTVAVLQGHTSNVRALVWSEEVPYLLLSGSWDGTIRVWDIRHSKCLHVIYDHHADVYGLASHPARPFVFVSSSRDTSMRFWTMDETLFAKMKARSVLAGGNLLASDQSDSKETMKPTAALRLCGPASQELGRRLKECKSELTRMSLLFDYWTAVPGLGQLWDLVDSLVNNRACTGDASLPGAIQHIADLRKSTLSRARLLETTLTAVEFGKGKREDRLAAAAELYLRLGMVREYCELQIQLGRWERAMAVAPAAGMPYWKAVGARYAAALLAKKDAAGAVPILLATGEVEQVVQVATAMGDTADALLVAVSDAAGQLPRLPNFAAIEEAAAKEKEAKEAQSQSQAAGKETKLTAREAKEAKERKDAEAAAAAAAAAASRREPVPVTELVRDVIELMAADFFAQGSPVQAACCHLAVGDPLRAVERLVQGDEALLALAVCRVLKLQFADHVHRAVAVQCESLGLWDEAFTCLQSVREAKQEITLLAARFVGASNKKADFYAKCGVRSAEAFVESAEQLVKDGNRTEAVLCYVAGGDAVKATELGLAALRELVARPSWGVDEALRFLTPLHSVNAAALSSAPLRLELLAYSFLVAAHTAVWRGYTPIVSALFDAVRAAVARGGFAFPVSPHQLKLHEASYFASIDPSYATALLTSLLSESGLAPKLKTAALAVQKSIGAAPAARPGAARTNIVIPLGSSLPSGSRRFFPANSVLSKRSVQGTRLLLEDGASAISRSEALMLVRCTPFSPLLTGSRIALRPEY